MNDEEILTVSSLNSYIKKKFSTDENLRRVKLRGEISNFKLHSSGHMYFSIKDEKNKVDAVMFRYQNATLRFKPVNGMKIIVFGKVDVYDVTGRYQFYVKEMKEDGVGNLFLAFENLKKKLLSEGLIQRKKKLLPKYPKKIGVVTSPTGAVIQDIISTIERRWPYVEIILWPTIVQGLEAKYSIKNNIELANKTDIDILIIGRGGGSIEDLWAFNEEIVARTIIESQIPIISAVGHQTDTTIADLVADVRAPTPTAAAEISVPNIIEIRNYIQNYRLKLNKHIFTKIEFYQNNLIKLKNRQILKDPMIFYENRIEKLGLLVDKMNTVIKSRIKDNKNNLNSFHDRINQDLNSLLGDLERNLFLLNEKLIILNPLETVKRGYSIVKINNQIISTVKNLNIEDEIDIKLKDGHIVSEIKEIKEN